MSEQYIQADINALRQNILRIYRDLDEMMVRLSNLERATLPSATQEFHAVYPQSEMDPELWELIGIQPEASIEQDKAAVREVLARKFG